VPESLPELAATPEIALPDTPRAGEGASRAVALAEVVLASGFPTQFALGALLLLAGLAPFGEDGRLSMRYLLLLMPADTALLLALVVWRLRAGGESVSAVLFGTRPWARECWLGVGLVPLVLGAVIATVALLRATWPWLHNVDANPFEALITSRTNALPLGGARVGLVLYSLIFGAGHVIQGYDVGIVTAALGLAWGTVFLWRRSILATSVSHAGFNAAQILQFVVFRT